MYIYNSISFSPVELNTSLQAVAARVNLNTKLTICNVYISKDHALNQQLLNDICNQLPQPSMVLPHWETSMHTITGDRLQRKAGRTVYNAVQREHHK